MRYSRGVTADGSDYVRGTHGEIYPGMKGGWPCSKCGVKITETDQCIAVETGDGYCSDTCVESIHGTVEERDIYCEDY